MCSPRRAALSFGEPIADRESKTRQDIAAVEDIILAEEDRLVSIEVDAHRPFLGIDVPDQADSRAEVLIELPGHFLGCVSLAENLRYQVRNDLGYLPVPSLGAFAVSAHEKNTVSGMRTMPGKIRIMPSAQTIFPRSWVLRKSRSVPTSRAA